MTSQDPKIAEEVLADFLDLAARWDNGVPLHSLLVEVGTTSSNTILYNTVQTAFKHLGSLDYVIHLCWQGRLRRRTRWLARWALCHYFYIRSLPFNMAADVAVHYAKRRYHASEGKKINALLRQVSSRSEKQFMNELWQNGPPEVRMELGAELYRHWRERFTESQLRNLAALLQKEAPIIVRERRRLPADGPDQRQRANAEKHLRAIPPPPWAPQEKCFECIRPAQFFHTKAVQHNAYYVQDPSTMLAPHLLQVRPDQSVGDFCSAPGGKTTILADNLQGNGELLCVDRNKHRLKKVKANLQHLPECHFYTADLAEHPFKRNFFDRILLDVPCTNTGVIRRRPDVRWRFSSEGLRTVTRLQERILQNAAASVKPGGKLVYSTCSLEPEENHRMIEHFLEMNPHFVFELQNQLLPTDRHDGAYAARLRRVK